MNHASAPIVGEPILLGEPPLHGLYVAGGMRAAVLLVSPLFDEKRCAHRAVVACARALAAAGAAVLQVDLTGTGNSAGELAQIDLARWQADLRTAAAALRERTSLPLNVVAFRAGALLAAGAGLDAARLVMVQPVTAGKSYLNQARTRRMIQDKMTGDTPPEIDPHEIEGEVLSPTLFAELQALSLPETAPAGVRLLQCSFNDKLLSEYERLLARWGEVPVQTVVAEPCWLPHTPGEYAALAQAVCVEVLA